MRETGAQTDLDKLRRIPWYHAHSVLTSLAVLCTVGAPLALFAAELGLSNDRIGLLGGIMPFLQVASLLSIPLIAQFGARLVSTLALAIRYAFLCLFLVAPMFIDRPDFAFALLLVAMLGFSLMRALAEGAVVPWSQEFTPISARGRIAGRNAVLYVPVALVVSWLIQGWLDGQSGVARFYPVFAAGIVAGLAGAFCLLGMRGGRRPAVGGTSGTAAPSPRISAMIEPLRDRNFLVFLAASSVQYAVIVAQAIFLVLFFRDFGLQSGELVFLSALIPVGAAIGTIAAGWLIDRYGTRAVYVVLVAGQAVLFLMIPLIPEGTSALMALAATVFVLVGLFLYPALSVAGIYLLNVIPPASKEAYTTLHYITVGLVSGAATWGAGLLLVQLTTHPVAVADIVIEPFATLFVLTAVLSVISGWAFHSLREENGLSVRAFFANFTTGHPMRALIGIQQFGGETSEDRRRELAFGLGSFGSPLAKKELIEALRDPSFDVRHEAVRALGHLAPHADVVAALDQVLQLDGLIELQYAALESLGRMRARDAADRVAGFLDSGNALLRARAIRSLGEMRAHEHALRLRAALAGDPDLDCRLAAVSALGKIGDADSLPGLVATYLELARDAEGMGEPRSKVVLLAIAKIMHCEESFAYFWRYEQRKPGEAVSDLLLGLSKVVSARASSLAPGLAAASSAHQPGKPGIAWAAVLVCAPLLVDSAHPDAQRVARLLAGVADVEAPHPALVILAILGLRRALRR